MDLTSLVSVRTPRVAIVSDTHVPRFAKRLPGAIARIVLEHPTHVLHCGDMTDIDALADLVSLAPFDAVAGNNDDATLERRFGRRKIVDCAGTRIGLVHGDGLRGSTFERARDAFANERVDIIAFGHSHVPSCVRLDNRSDNRWIINPGSPTDKRRQSRYSFAMLEWIDGVCVPRLILF